MKIFYESRSRGSTVMTNKQTKITTLYIYQHVNLDFTGSRSAFEFRSPVNLSGPNLLLYLALWTGLAGAIRLMRSDFMLHIVELTFTKGAEVRDLLKGRHYQSIYVK